MAPPTRFALLWMRSKSLRSKPTITARSLDGRRERSSTPPSNQEQTSFTEMCGNLFATTNWTPPTSLRIQEVFRKENTARINLDSPLEVRFAGTRPFSSWTTKAPASVRPSRRRTPYQQLSNGAADTQIYQNCLHRAVHEPMCWDVPTRWARSSIPPPRER